MEQVVVLDVASDEFLAGFVAVGTACQAWTAGFGDALFEVGAWYGVWLVARGGLVNVAVACAGTGEEGQQLRWRPR